ncbi:MAG TPA: endonuclease III [Acidobacteriota bacterium]|nr:endonuclease III [Acidobacteriota bacterium]
MDKKKSIANEKRVQLILENLDESYPEANCALLYTNPLELLIATILSAQCTDERVNTVTRNLFQKYRNPEDYAGARREIIETDIRSTGFYRNKAKSIQGACTKIINRFNGRVPDNMQDLLQLPGVARKTANVVLGTAFGKADGVVVDTHVSRISRRLDLTCSENAEIIERDLMLLLPRERWISFSHQMIAHGRKICKARKPLCALCPLRKVCSSGDKTAS